jgi:hypothetical protein
MTQRFKTINQIVNQVALETGIPKQSDIFASNDPATAQLIALSNACGYELLQDEAWEGLARLKEFTTQSGDDGKYDLPDDFAYILNQTAWDRTNNVPLGGPLSAQEWEALQGRDLVSSTIYATFREVENQFWIYPQPPKVGIDIAYEYTSRNWVNVNGTGTAFSDEVTNSADTVLYEPHLFERLLKMRFLEARGFDTSMAAAQYEKSFVSWAGKDKGGPVLNAGRRHSGIPYLDGLYNTPDSGFGS